MNGMNFSSRPQKLFPHLQKSLAIKFKLITIHAELCLPNEVGVWLLLCILFLWSDKRREYLKISEMITT